MHLQYTQTMKNKFMLKHNKTTPPLKLKGYYQQFGQYIEDTSKNL